MPFSHCPVCNAEAAAPFFRLESAPALCHRLCPTREEALAQPRGPVALSICGRCGLVYNRDFDASRIRYDGTYENALHFSGVFRDYANGLAKNLVDRHNLSGKTVAEIGCGDGQFLGLLCDHGAKNAVGFDPAFDAERHDPPASGKVRIVPELFDAAALRNADLGLVCCRQVLEHIETPSRFLLDLRQALGDQRPAVFFEVPSAMHSLERRGFWDIIYEHVTYYTPEAIRTLFERAGFDVATTHEVYAKQFLTIEAHPGAANRESIPEPHRIAELQTLATRFNDEYTKLRDTWQRHLQQFRNEGRSTVIWGAGSKTVMLLNNLDIDTDTVPYVVDRNPRKHNCYVIGTGQQIVAPESLRTLQPDTVLLMNPSYRGEVGAELRELGCEAKLVVVE
jgi:SAM-dependent methyltransferase